MASIRAQLKHRGTPKKTPDPDRSQVGLFEPKPAPAPQVSVEEFEARDVLKKVWLEVSRAYDSVPQGWARKAALHSLGTNPGLVQAEGAIDREYKILSNQGQTQERRLQALSRIKEGTAFYCKMAGQVFMKTAGKFKDQIRRVE